ncbi:oxidoreductase [Enemella evansiae]|uniref:Oxidoreductase n=1 Tax=Enemella evansiae TaxID=2016499 RepID=A0A255GP99_9ACTN|nr:phosphogluconate dehydrogenase C-terminal domain-containing protein [Enemella evansiae]OYO17647.1 oxidoreductase [Enemella evansiae]
MTEKLKIAVVGAGGKMGMRISRNLQRTANEVHYIENSENARAAMSAEGREASGLDDSVKGADVVVLAVPDIVLDKVTKQVVPQLDAGTVVLTLDPAAAYANLLHPREDIFYAVAHPCHPSIFLRRYTDEEHADTFGGEAAGMDVVAAFEYDDRAKRDQAEQVIREMYAPILDVHWVTVKQLAQCEPTLVETVACMVGDLLKEALDEAVNTMGVPEAAARSMLLGHIQVSLANSLQGDNPYSDACHIAMKYGRKKIIRDDWKVIFADDELDRNLEQMLHLDRPLMR